MEKFMLILREDCEKFSRMAEEERFLMAPVMLEWIRSIAEAGQYVAGGPLAISGRYVSKDSVLSDGPFIEAKEGVSGYDIILAESLNQAVSIAQTCPVVMMGLGVR